ncbi:MAG: hypothetical protein ACREBM_06920 [Sphingomicrobium sp.]
MARGLLITGAILLAATALFHMTGLSSVSGWLEGGRGTIVALLWSTAAASWVIVALIWICAALRPSPALKMPVWISALIPISVGIPLLAMVDAGHPGGYLLLLSAVLAAIGAGRQR